MFKSLKIVKKTNKNKQTKKLEQIKPAKISEAVCLAYMYCFRMHFSNAEISIHKLIKIHVFNMPQNSLTELIKAIKNWILQNKELSSRGMC